MLGHFKYNSRSNVTEFTDANQVTFTFGYDSTGEDIESVTLPANGPTPGGAATIGYEDSANTHFPTSVFDFQNHSKGTPSADPSYVYTYDSKGRIKSAEDGEDNVYEYFWNDADGTLDKMEDPKENASPGTGGITDYNYETTGINKGDLREIIYPPPLGKIRFTHDATSRIKTVEVLRSDEQVLHSAMFTYDKLDRAELVTYSPTEGTVDYDYDANGNLTSRNDSGFGNVVFDVTG